MTSLRVGVSGCAAAAADAAQRIRLHEDCDLVAVHAPEMSTAQTFADTHNLGFATDDFAKLLGYGVDFVLLTGPTASRLAQVQLAAEQAVHCLVTAPIAADLATARQMAAACAAAEVRLGVAVADLADPVVEQLRRMIVADWLGAVVAVQAISGTGEMLHENATADVADPFFALLGPPLHVTSWLLGRSAVQVTGQAMRTFRPDVADGAAATATLRGGALCTFLGSRMSQMRAFAVHGTAGGLRLAGDRIWLRGRKEYRGPIFDYLVPGREVSLSRDELHGAINMANPRADACGRFARWIEDTDDFSCPIEQALLDLEVVDAMRRAAESGRAQSV